MLAIKSIKLSKTFLLSLYLLAMAFTITPAVAATYTVTKTADTNDGSCSATDCSIREAINNANNGDTVSIPAGTYTITRTGSGEESGVTGDLDLISDISIIGSSTSGATIIDAAEVDRAFDITWNVKASISNLTIINGSADYGGAIFMRPNSSLSVSNSTFKNNKATQSGGAIYNKEGTLTIKTSTFDANTAAKNGGALMSNNILTISDSTITNNVASGATPGIGLGGGIVTFETTAVTEISNCIINNNEAHHGGGGVYNASTTTINNSTLDNNWASVDGGGLFSFLGTTTVTNTTISNNTVEQFGGGGIYHEAEVNLTNVTISGNTSAWGAGILAYTGHLTMTNTTITDNTATDSQSSGGILLYDGTAAISNSIIAKQNATTNLNGYDCGISGTGSFTSKGYNAESGPPAHCLICSCGFTATGDLQNTDPLLEALADNGGHTKTHKLATGSPAIDSGSCVSEKDQRETTRPQGSGCDIGAFELEAEASLENINRLFDWAEQTYSQYFTPPNQATFELDGYTARYYPNTNNYLGVKEGQVYVYGDVFGGLLNVGEFNTFYELIK